MEKILKNKKIVIAILSILIGLISIFIVGKLLTSPAVHKKSIEVLDEKKDNVIDITGALTVASTALTLLPGDIATPVAEQLVDISGGFAVVLGVVVLEKYLLVILFGACFYIMIPVAMIINAINQFFEKDELKNLTKKLVLFGVAMAVVIPVSLSLSSLIDKTYKQSITKTIDQAKNASDDLEGIAKDSGTESEDEDEKAWYERIGDTVKGATKSVKERVSESIETIKKSVSKFTEALVIMVVVNCVIPVLTFIFLIWIIKVLFGLEKSPYIKGRIPGRGRLNKAINSRIIQKSIGIEDDDSLDEK